MAAAAPRPCRQLDKFKLQDLIAVLYALAKLGSPVDAGVAEAAAHAAGSRGISLQAVDIVNLLWALAASDQLRSEAAAPLLAALAELPVADGLSAASLHQLAQVQPRVSQPHLELRFGDCAHFPNMKLRCQPQIRPADASWHMCSTEFWLISDVVLAAIKARTSGSLVPAVVIQTWPHMSVCPG